MELFEIYKAKLEEDSNSGLILARFYSELFGFSITPNTIKMMNKLLKEFKKETIFFAISDIFSSDNIDHSHIYGLLKYVCRARVTKEQVNLPKKVDLSQLKKDIDKAKNRKLKIGNPFDD